MATDIDELQIQIQASAKGANSSVTALTKRLEKLSNVISGIDAKKVNNLGIGLNSVGRGGNTASAGLNKTATSATKAAKSFDGLASAFGKFYATYFLFIRGAKGIWRNIESSMDYVETSNYFSVALGQIGQQFEEAGYESAELYTEALTSELSDLNRKLTGYTLGESGEAIFGGNVGLGMDIEQMMNFQAKTLAVTNSVGLLGETSINTAKAISMLAGDLSSLTNTDLKSVMTNLSSGLIGQSRSLYKFGIDITANTLQQYALAEGIEKSVSEMTQAEKMQLRLLAILDQSNVAQTDLATTINSVANQYRVFNQQVDNTGRTLGNLFLPIVQNVLPYVNGLIIALNNLFTSLGFEIYGETWLEDLQQGISGGVQEDFEDLGGSVDDATESLEEFKKGVRGFDELKVLTGGASVGSGIVGELEGQIDLTESITQAVADYENSWNEAFATAENKASEFAKQLTEDFDGVAEMFEKIFPAIAGIGGALATYKIVTGISGIVTSLGALGSPVGVAALAAGVLIGVGTAIKQVHDNAVEADLENRFGDIALSMEDIEEVARKIVDNGNLTALSTVLSEMGELGDIESEIQTAIDTINKLNWKVSIGMELSEEEEGQYKSAIDSYVKNANDYVTQQQYSTIVGIKLFLGDSQTSEEVQSVVNEFYSKQSGKLKTLGEQLNAVTTAAWNDGLLTIDEVEVITNIQMQMAEIQKELTNSEFQARLQLLEADYSGAELTPESYEELKKKRQELIDQYTEDYNESLVFTLAQVNLAFQAKLDEANTEEAKKKINAEWDNAIKELTEGRDLQISQMALQSLSFDYNTLIDTFGEDMDAAFSGVTNNLSIYAKKFAEEADWAEQGVADLMTRLVLRFEKEAGKAGQENFKKIVESMMPTQDIEELAESFYENTGKIPQAIADALASKYALNSISGNLDSMYKLMLLSADSDSAKAVLEAMEERGIDVPEFLADGVISNKEVAVDSVTDMLSDLEDYINYSDLPSAAENLGKEIAESFSFGLGGMEGVINGKAASPTITIENGMVTYDPYNVTYKGAETSSSESQEEATKNLAESMDKLADAFKNPLALKKDIIFSPIQLRANGGMVTAGQVFMARENGMSELVGNFGGQVGVANNDQIIQGIRQAAYEGFLAAMSQGGSSGGVTVVLEGDAAQMFKIVRQEESKNYKKTGNSVFVH